MRKRTFFNKVIFWCNLLAAFLLLLSFVLPYIPPKSYPTLSLLSLLVSVLILINIFFVIYWVVMFNWRFFISFILVVISYFYFNVFYEVSSEVDASQYKNSLSVLSYNVRLFNAYEDKPTKDASSIIAEILSKQNPDVFCIQEYFRPNNVDFSSFPYQYIHFKTPSSKLGHAIFSKYPLINTGAFDFKDTYNNTLYADVVKGKDTLRIYSVHLESLGIIPRFSYFRKASNTRLRRTMTSAFERQQDQVNAILAHKKQTKHRVLLCGDFNNTPFSYTYRKLKNNMTDAFRERGNGLGTTFLFEHYPMRIDFIFASPNLDILSFKTMEKTSSDHTAVRATVGW